MTFKKVTPRTLSKSFSNTSVSLFCSFLSLILAGVSCKENQFRCLKSGKCIPENWYCDGDNDCGARDRSDESNCSLSACTAVQFRCSDGKCVPISWKCDGFDDCVDGSDELKCGKWPKSALHLITPSHQILHTVQKKTWSKIVSS